MSAADNPPPELAAIEKLTSAMMNRWKTVIGCALLLAGCNAHGTGGDEELFSAAAPGDTIRAVRLAMDDDYMGGCPIAAIGDRVVFSNSGRMDKRFSVYRCAGDSLSMEGAFLSPGRGPREINMAELVYDGTHREITLIGPYNMENRFCRVRLEPFSNLYDARTWEYATLPFLSGSARAPCLKERSVFLMMGSRIDSLNMFSLLDIDNARLTPLDFRYPEVAAELSRPAQSLLWSGRLYKHPARLRYLYSAQDFRYAFIFELDDNDGIRVVRAIYDQLPAIRTTEDIMRPYTFEDSCFDGFYQLACDDRFIYVGYRDVDYGALRDRARQGLPSSGPCRRINVFDWEGRFVRRLVPDVPLTGPMIVHDGALIARADDPDTGEVRIMRYAL